MMHGGRQPLPFPLRFEDAAQACSYPAMTLDEEVGVVPASMPRTLTPMLVWQQTDDWRICFTR